MQQLIISIGIAFLVIVIFGMLAVFLRFQNGYWFWEMIVDEYPTGGQMGGQIVFLPPFVEEYIPAVPQFSLSDAEKKHLFRRETPITEELPICGIVSPRETSVPIREMLDDGHFSKAVVSDMLGTTLETHPVLDMPIIDRKHVIIIGDTGNGKTQTQIRMIVSDIQHGAQVFWLSPHLALYNQEDQPTDLRPIAGHFKQVFNYQEIGTYLSAFAREANRRLPLYRNDEPVGPTIVVYLDEWPGIVEVCEDVAVEALRMIAREGRKVRIFLVVASQDALAETLGVRSGVRAQFNTRLVGSVDSYSWVACVGKGIPRVTPTRKGEWMCVRGGHPMMTVHIHPAPPELVQEIAHLPPVELMEIRTIEVIPQRTNVPSEVIRVMEWVSAEPNISHRELARRLWPESGDGGGRYALRAKLLRDQIEEAVTLFPVTEEIEQDEDGSPEPSNTVTP